MDESEPALVREMRLLREATERAAAEARSRHFGEMVTRRIRQIVAATNRGADAAPEPAPVVLEQVAPAPAPDPQRRLALLRSLGGDVKWRSGKWEVSRMSALVQHEKSRPRSSEKTIRADLHEAAEAERRQGPKHLPSWHP